MVHNPGGDDCILRRGDNPRYTLPETNIAPTNGWLEYYFPIGFLPIFRGYVSFREGNMVSSGAHLENKPGNPGWVKVMKSVKPDLSDAQMQEIFSSALGRV